MRSESILRALSEVRPAYLDEARASAGTKTRSCHPLRRAALIAATVALLALCRPSERSFYLAQLDHYMP